MTWLSRERWPGQLLYLCLDYTILARKRGHSAVMTADEGSDARGECDSLQMASPG